MANNDPTGSLPPEILESIAVSNAKSIGEQPAVLANLALANQIANINLAQQQALTAQQAMMQLTLATVAKCVEIISQVNPSSPGAPEQMQVMATLIESMTKGMGGAVPGQSQSPSGPPPSSSHHNAHHEGYPRRG